MSVKHARSEPPRDLRPFQSSPGRDTGSDRPSQLDVAGYFYQQRRQLAGDAGTLRKLIAAVESVGNLAPSQWAQWYGITLGFQPDLILELGRGHGNSTAMFCLAGERIRDVEIVSVCLSGDWIVDVAAKVERIVGAAALRRLDARMADIATVDYERIIAAHQRVLVLWDAHGFEVAEVVLGQILPALVGREHLLLMHDIIDNRYADDEVTRAYTAGLWKPRPSPSAVAFGSDFNIGWMRSIFEQIIPLSDFSARNDVEIGSGEHEFHRFFDPHPERVEQMLDALGPDLFSLAARWAFLSLSGRAGPWFFPTVDARLPRPNTVDVAVDGYPSMPINLRIEPTPWTYAATLTWRPVSESQAGRRTRMRVRVHVEGSTIGIGLLNRTGGEFIERKAVAPGDAAVDVILNVGDPSLAGLLVVQSWAAPVPGLARIEAVSLEW
jgi:hypothetical protein